MQCDHARDQLGAYVDGELSASDNQTVADRLQSCPACASEVDDIRRLSQQLHATGRETAPPGLSLRIHAELAKDIAGADAEALQWAPARRRFWNAPVWRQTAALAAACVMSSVLTWSVMTWPGSNGPGSNGPGSNGPVISGSDLSARIVSDVVSAHIRSLLQDSPIQVASSDSHTVKPWFTGRIDFSPDVNDFAAQGFPLLGGRVDYIGDRRVGAVVYKRNLHLVNVFMWPSTNAEAAAVQRSVSKGYNVLSWNKNGITYRAVSDLNLDELRQLQAML